MRSEEGWSVQNKTKSYYIAKNFSLLPSFPIYLHPHGLFPVPDSQTVSESQQGFLGTLGFSWLPAGNALHEEAA